MDSDGLRVNTAASTAKCPETVMQAIYGPKSPTKSKDLEESQQRWWRTYSERKKGNDNEEYLANSMVYDPDHLPNSPTKQQQPQQQEQAGEAGVPREP